MKMKPARISVAEATEMLNEGVPPNERVSKMFVCKAIQNGSFPGSYVGKERKTYYIPRAAFMEYLSHWRSGKV